MTSDSVIAEVQGRSPRTFDENFQEIIQAYVSLGFSQQLIAQWSLPEGDGRSLTSHLEVLQPRNVLEVGTFVGEATLLMAAYLPAGGKIHTVDPNFPLERELGAMQSQALGENLEVRHQELARRAAHKLGVEDRIIFHAGGFSTGTTFTSHRTDPQACVPVIGPQVCQTHGPFDLIFIDGLHYAEAVLSDIRLATRFLADHGRIIIHDVFGMWGSNVRRAIFRFLEDNDEFEFMHGPYAKVADSIGVLQKRKSAKVPYRLPDMWKSPSGMVMDEAFVSSVATMVVNRCAPKRIIGLGAQARGILAKFEQQGVSDVHMITTAPITSEPEMEARGQVTSHSFETVFRPEVLYDVCVVFCLGNELDQSALDNLIESSVLCSRTILLGVTPPGETGFGDPCGKPIAWWVKEYWKHRYRFHDVIRPELEPLKYSYSLSPILPVRSSELSNVYLVTHEDSSSDAAVLEQVLLEKERRIEDLSLQSLCTDILLRGSLQKLDEAQKQIERYGRAMATYEQSVEYAIGYKLGKLIQAVPLLGRWLNALRSKPSRL